MTTIVWPPIRALNHMTNGRTDLAVWVQGGGILPGYEAVLRFNGKKYPGNPTVPPAVAAKGELPGVVLIGPHDVGQPLFE